MRLTLATLFLILPLAVSAEIPDIEEPSVVTIQKETVRQKNNPVETIAPPEPESVKHILRLTGMAPGPKISIVLSLDGAVAIMHQGDNWRGVTVTAVNQKAQTVKVTIGGTSHTLKLRGYSAVEFSND